MRPDTLYKYLHPDRVDVVQLLQIRFTQVSALNDPFESLPGIMQKDRTWYLEQFNAGVEKEIVQHGITSESKKKQYRRARKREFSSFLRRATDKKWLVERSDYVQHMADNIHGCLSLSATAKNILMWSHYCQHHTGYVIGFHSEHQYFGESVCEVVYSEVRPSYNPLQSKHSDEIFYTKSKDWSYEQEYRKFHSFVEANNLPNGHSFLPFRNPELHNDTNRAIKLFPLPKDSIKCLILGWKSSPELEKKLRLALELHDIAKTPMYRARPSLTRYAMDILPA